MTLEEQNLKIEQLTKEVEQINRTCCSLQSVEARARNNLLLEQALTKLENINIDLEDTKRMIRTHDTYLYIVVGIFIAIRFFGLDDVITSLVTGQG